MTPFFRRQIFTLIFILALLAAGSTGALAQWSHDPAVNTPLIPNPNDYLDYSNVIAVSDGADGLVSVWTDYYDIYGQRVGPVGNRMWGNSQRLLVSDGDWTGVPQIVGDGAGGLFLVWLKPFSSSTLVYAQHFDASGNPTWGTNGVQVQEWVVLGTIHAEPQVVSNGTGGIIVGWIHNPGPSAVVVAQNIDLAGNRTWASGTVSTISGNKASLVMEDALAVGEVFVAWQEWVNNDNWDLRVQKMSSTGTQLWNTDDYRSLATRNGDQINPQLARTGQDDLIAVWTDMYYGTPRVYYQRKWADGNDGWSADEGANWRGFYTQQEEPQISRNALGDVYLIYKDQTPNGGGRLAAQYFANDQYNMWGPYGQTLQEDPRLNMGAAALLADDNGGCFAVCENNQYGNTFSAQHLNNLGEETWTAGRGAFAMTSLGYRAGITLLPDDQDGLIAVWAGESVTSASGIPTGQRLDHNGFMGNNAFPVLAAVDRPNDQGGEVTLSWSASPLDNGAFQAIASYSLWIRQSAKSAALDVAHEPATTELKNSELAALLRMPEAELAGVMAAGWAFAAQVPAMLSPDYAALCPTYGDSSQTGIVDTEFMVVAHHQDSGICWDSSNVLSGYSVDNLAPGAPVNLAGANNAGAVDLTWTASGVQDSDLARYRVYRGTESGFTLDAGSLLATSETTAFQDASPSGTVYYRVTAVDAHGNEGAASAEVELVLAVSAVGDTPTAFAHRGNFPNPFNPMTNIAFDLPHAAQVRVSIYDASGRLVTTVLNESLGAGPQQVRWNGQDAAGQGVSSGVYFSRVEAGSFRATRSMTLVR
jgi:hypothetical protein